MARDPRPASVLLRMSPRLREGLRAAASDAGCSVNAFCARSHFIGAMSYEMDQSEFVPLVKKYDAEDPGYFVRWEKLEKAEHEAREREGRRGGA